MTLENKSTAHAVSTSTGGRGERAFRGLGSADSVQETGRLVKSRREFDGGGKEAVK